MNGGYYIRVQSGLQWINKAENSLQSCIEAAIFLQQNIRLYAVEYNVAQHAILLQ